MDGDFDRTVLSRLPLAEAVLTLTRWALQEDRLDALYEEHRGRCHERLLAFPAFVDFLFDCLSLPWKSARAGLVKANDEGRLPVSVRAFYDKLENTPVDVSLAFFRETSGALRSVLATPEDNEDNEDGRLGYAECPDSLRGMTTLLMDGKVVKHVGRRLQPLRLDRQTACKLLGPRTLVVFDRWTGLLHDLVVDLDGEANEIKHLAALLERVPQSVPGPWLVVADRAFGIFEACRNVLNRGGHFLFRKHGGTKFVADPERPARHATDRFGRPIVEEWGWIERGKPSKTKPPERIAVRQITVRRDASELVLIASLTDATTHPAEDLLDAYLDRWDIENAFQHVTEVFHLRSLISSSPRGMLFQLATAFLMHNVVQVVKQFLARQERRDVRTISIEMLFRDVQEELVSLKRLTPPTQAVAMIERSNCFATIAAVRQRIEELLVGRWCNRWNKANHRPRDPSRRAAVKARKLRQLKAHDSVQRILDRDGS